MVPAKGPADLNRSRYSGCPPPPNHVNVGICSCNWTIKTPSHGKPRNCYILIEKLVGSALTAQADSSHLLSIVSKAFLGHAAIYGEWLNTTREATVRNATTLAKTSSHAAPSIQVDDTGAAGRLLFADAPSYATASAPSSHRRPRHGPSWTSRSRRATT